MRSALLLLLTAVIAACSNGDASERPTKAARRAVPPPSVTTLALPGEDGRVHIVSVSDRWQTRRCLVHVGPAGSSIGCMQTTDTPPQIEPEDQAAR